MCEQPTPPYPVTCKRETRYAAACTNAYDYGDPVCMGNSTLYWGTGNHSDLSCAHCVCDEGWSGADCGRCDDISVCPSKMTVDGEVSGHARDANVAEKKKEKDESKPRFERRTRFFMCIVLRALFLINCTCSVVGALLWCALFCCRAQFST